MIKSLLHSVKQAAKLPVNEKDELAVDWLNGRRTPDANQLLKAAIIGSEPWQLMHQRFSKHWLKQPVLAQKQLLIGLVEQGIPVKGLIGLGGVAKKSPFIMQMMADVMNMPIRIHKSEQTCAVGAAMFAATAAGIYEKVEDAMNAMGQGFDAEYFPDESKTAIYAKRYEQYKQLGKFIEEYKN